MPSRNVDSESELRVFLSVDLEGSTWLKEQRSHAALVFTFDERRKGVENVSKARGGFDDETDLNSSEIIPILLEGYDRENWDWASIIEERFECFHSAFVDSLREIGIATDALDENPWKSRGDELIYSFVVSSRETLHSMISRFLDAIRTVDKPAGLRFRLKGAAWTAGFPIRNRKIIFPGSVEREPLQRREFLGPDMDLGFRLTEYAHPGLLTVSMDLAELPGNAQELDQLKGRIVGWRVLKGVWNDLPSPIIWITDSGGGRQPSGEDWNGRSFRPEEIEGNSLVSKWESNEAEIEEVKELRKAIEEIRNNAPSHLGLIAPYIKERDGIPPQHQRILDIIQSIPEYRPALGRESDDSLDEPGTTKGIEETMRKKLSSQEGPSLPDENS